jgi:dipeptidyl aminopeptidase/acylaminoacyl peptidase
MRLQSLNPTRLWQDSMLRSTLLVPLFLVACGGTEVPPSPVPPLPPPAVAPVTPTAAPLAPDATPTERTADQKARDDARVPLANAILDAYTNFRPRFSQDRKKVLFGSRRDGNVEFYLSDVASPSAAPIAITRGPERAREATFTRDGKSILFVRDTGADENWRIYQVGLDGKNETCLTPGPVLRRSLPIEPKDKPGTLVYSQRDVKSAATEIVVHAIGGGPNVVYTDPNPTSLEGVTNDGTRALVLRRYSSSHYVLFELDLGVGKTRRLYPDEGKKVAVHAAAYAPNGTRAYVAADDGAEGQFLYQIDVTSGAIQQQYRQSDPPTAAVDGVIVSPRGDRLAIVIDEGDHGEVRIVDAKTLKVTAKVKAPLGSVGVTRFSEDGLRIGATLTVADAPTDVFGIDATTGVMVPLRHDVRPGLDKLDPMETSVETVKAFDGLSIPIIVYLPKGARTRGTRLPVIAEFHGGPSGSSYVGWDTFARFYTALGYAYLQPNVRGSTGYGRAYEMADNREKRADWLKDLESVNAWAKAQPWADPQRVVVMGGSYGGYTVLMALTRQPTLWRAGVDYVGIANLFTFLKSTDQGIRKVWVDEFGDLDADKALLDAFSPLRDVDSVTAPLYVYAGQNDPRVPREESDQIVSALRKRSVPVEYQVAANEGHSLDHRENRVEFMTRVARFLEDTMK